MPKKVLLTGGGTGGHIYPLVAVAERLKEIGSRDLSIDYIGPKSNLSAEFLKFGVRTHTILGAKLRRYFDLRNLVDIPKFFLSIIEALIKMFFIMPDVVFSKGGSGSFPVVLAAKFYFIPVVIHESDSVPSLTTKISAKFAKRIGVAFESTASFFPNSKKIFVSGNPVRRSLLDYKPSQDQAKRHFEFDPEKPVLLVLGGSQGAMRINDVIETSLEDILPKVQVIHQAGYKNFKSYQHSSKFLLKNSDLQNKYKVFGFMQTQDLKTAMSAADIILSRAGSGAIFEIAVFGKPSILVPLNQSAGDHQRVNAYEYAGTGAALVIENQNLTSSIIVRHLEEILSNPERIKSMSQSAEKFAKINATDIIVRNIIPI